MTTTTVLLLLVAAASTIAFSPPPYYLGPPLESQHVALHDFAADRQIQPNFIVRRRRDIPTASKSGSGAISFASSSSSSSGSGSSPGFASISSRSGSYDTPGYNGANPGGFAYPSNFDYSNNIPNYGFGAPNPYQNPYAGNGYVPVDFNALFQQYINFMQRLAQQQVQQQQQPQAQSQPHAHAQPQPQQPNGLAPNDLNTRSAFPGPDNFGQPGGFNFPGASNFGVPNGNFGNFGGSPDGQVAASASASLSPRGGFGSASISPPPGGNPELGTRMGSVPPSDGENFAVFSSSSSGSSDTNGVKKSFKEATSVINDNGKVTTFHVSDP